MKHLARGRKSKGRSEMLIRSLKASDYLPYISRVGLEYNRRHNKGKRATLNPERKRT
jgi:hypothetical protein